MRAVFFGTPEFAVPSLAALAASRHPVLAVVTQPDRRRGRGLASEPTPVRRLAERLGLPVLSPERLRGAFVAELGALAPETLAVVAYGKILPAEILALTPGRAVNLHASLLPCHRGAAPIQSAILAGDAETGVTTMQMEAGLDTGPVFRRRVIAVDPGESAGALGVRLAALGASLLVETLDELERGVAVAVPQDPALASYAPRLEAGDAVVDWRLPAARIDRQVRAYDPWPGAVTVLPGGKRLKLRRTRALAGGEPGAAPGSVLRAADGGLEVACGDGRLLLLEVQPEGKRAMSAAALVHGRLIRPGDRLGGL